MPMTAAGRAEGARRRARALAERLHGLDQAGEGRHDEAFCRSLLRELKGEGLLRHIVPAPYGGAAPEVEVSSVAAIREELARGSGLLDLMFVMQGLGSFPIALAGTDEQKRRFLPAVEEGRSVAAFAVTEPDAGSDLSAIRTAAHRTEDGWLLEGTKTLISNAPFADLLTVIARTGPEAGREGLSAFVVDGAAGGIERESIQTIAPHPLGTLQFRRCLVPAANLLGREGEGFRIAIATLDRFRATVGAAAVGFAQRALEEAVRFAKGRVAFGRPIAEFEGIQFKLAEMATRLEAARLLVARAAATIDRRSGDSRDPSRSPDGLTDPEPGEAPARPFPLSPLGEDPSREASMAKLFATEAAQGIVDEAVQIHGGRGLVCGSIVEGLYREVRALRIYEGTSEIQRTLIGRSLVGR